MTTAHPDPRLPVRSLSFVLVATLAAFLALLAVRGLFAPVDAAHGFGVDLAAQADAFYLHVKGDRDLALTAVLVALIAYRRPAPLALFVAATCVAPVFDCAFVATARGSLGYALAVHGSAAIYGVITAALLWRAHRRAARAAHAADRPALPATA